MSDDKAPEPFDLFGTIRNHINKFPLEKYGDALIDRLNATGGDCAVVILVNDQVTGTIVSTSNCPDGGYALINGVAELIREEKNYDPEEEPEVRH